jgi:capsule biosynthesis phosphatase
MLKDKNVIVVDIDGTLAAVKEDGDSYSDLSVINTVKERIHTLKNDGYWIILATSRNMRTYDGNIGQIMKHTAPVLIDWLYRNDIPYDEIHFGKPWCGHNGFYVDDRAIRPREFAELTLSEIEALIIRDRLFK